MFDRSGDVIFLRYLTFGAENVRLRSEHLTYVYIFLQLHKSDHFPLVLAYPSLVLLFVCNYLFYVHAYVRVKIAWTQKRHAFLDQIER